MGGRIDTLKNLIEQDPGNSRFRFMLAMEMANSGEMEEAAEAFRDLLERDPGYAAGYFHAGQNLEKMGRKEDARAVYQRGIEVTGASGDAHAREELEGALGQLGL